MDPTPIQCVNMVATLVANIPLKKLTSSQWFILCVNGSLILNFAQNYSSICPYTVECAEFKCIVILSSSLKHKLFYISNFIPVLLNSTRYFLKHFKLLEMQRDEEKVRFE